MLAVAIREEIMAPLKGRDPETIGELFQWTAGQFEVVLSRLESLQKSTDIALRNISDTIATHDRRLDLTDDILQKYVPLIPEEVAALKKQVRALEDNQTRMIAGGGVLVAVLQGLWPSIRAWLHLGGP